MRLLSAPLYRYAEPNRSADAPEREREWNGVDGAIFGLFLDWDPEILLVIETQPTDDGPRWHYGVAYVDYKPLRLMHKKVEVWSKPDKNFGSADSSYYCVIGATTRPADFDQGPLDSEGNQAGQE
jgi:hypothetical protein